jgi:hypothetical protein
VALPLPVAVAVRLVTLWLVTSVVSDWPRIRPEKRLQTLNGEANVEIEGAGEVDLKRPPLIREAA